MIEIRELAEFTDWLASLKDNKTRLRLARRLEKAQGGNFGDISPVGDSVFEMREHFGPGWRMYFIRRGQIVIVMLGGGDKATQRADIETAKKLAKTLED